MSQLIQSQLAQVRRRSILIDAGTGLCIAATAFIVLLAAGMFADWMMDLPYAVRAAWLALNLGATGYLLLRYAIRPILLAPDDDELALRVERWRPDFQTRLIAAVQLSRTQPPPGSSASLVRALVRQTEEMARSVAFWRVVQPDPLLRGGGVALGVILLSLIGLGFGRAVAAPLLKRALLVPNVEVPRKTSVQIHDGDRVIARGEGITLLATAADVIPSRGEVTIRYEDGRQARFSMTPTPDHRDQFTQRIENVQASFAYTVTLNDGTSKPHRITVADRPAINDLAIRQTYPQYTRLGTVSRSPGDLSLLAGSRLHLDINANKPLRPTANKVLDGNYLHLVGPEIDLPLTVHADNPSRLSITDAGRDGFVVPPGTTGFSIHLVDQDGLRSVDPVVYRVDVRPDQPPTVRVTYPSRREELVTPQATLLVGFEATDDLALGRLALRYLIRYPEGAAAMGADQDGAGDGLGASYFNGMNFEGKPFKRIDPQIDFNWGGGGPAPGIGADQFTVRWEGQVQPRYSELYTFTMRADDGCRLWINDKLLIDQFPGKYDQDYSALISLEANVKYNIRVEMMERWGEARVHLWWASPSQAREIIPRSRLYSTAGKPRPTPPQPPEVMALDGDGARITYFSGSNLSGRSTSATVPTVDLVWTNQDRPKGMPEKFSARITGYFIPRFSGLYTIRTVTDDGMRLWINDQMRLDEWKENAREKTAVLSLEAGKVYSFKYECNNRGGGQAEARLDWESDQQGAEIIPRERLFTTREKAQAAADRIAARRAEFDAKLAATQQDDPAAHTVVLEMSGTPRSVRGHTKLELSAFTPALPVGSIIEWWVQALDTNDVTGPGKAVSEHYLARVVTPDAKRADLLNQAADTFDQMRGVTETQEQLNQRLGELLTARPETP